ncbi:MAG: tRNA-dihydrouridine synthase family protein [Oligoflexia bacterium]|nr:tRNA-dihydrouridine synthase family protein [Oligoflexia bacterium]
MQNWIQNGTPAVVLAPMEGVTDLPMRTFQTSLPGYTHCVTEFLRISHNVLPKKCYPRHANELNHNAKTPSGIPVHFQLLGGNPQLLAASASLAVERGAKNIDINFGCPAPTVNKRDGGATILQYPDRIESILKEIRSAIGTKASLSAKIRLGWENKTDVFETVNRVAKAGADWVTIHARTKAQGYQPPVDWELIGKIKKEFSFPVVANGDIWNFSDFLRCREITGCEHFMVGRGGLANPHLANRIARELGIKIQELNDFPNSTEWKNYILDFIKISQSVSNNPNYTLSRVKQWLGYLCLRYPFAHYQTIKRIQNIDDLISLLPDIQFSTIHEKHSSS